MNPTRSLLLALLAATVALAGCTNTPATQAASDDGNPATNEATTPTPPTPATRSLALQTTCGSNLSVAIDVTPPNGTGAWLAEETLPDGWTPTDASGPFAVPTDTGVKFANAGDNHTTFTYNVAVPGDAQGTYTITGEYRYHPSMQARDTITGDEQITVACPG